MRLFLLLLSLVAAIPAAHARTEHDGQVWLNVTVMGKVADPVVYFLEVQPRSADGLSRLDQALLRGAVGVQLSPTVALYQGYAHVALPIEGGRDRNEERSFQQLSWMIGKPWRGELSSRTRLEQRWRSDGDDMGWRFREMLRFERPIDPNRQGPNLLGYAELFVALNDTDWGARAGFDQLRSFAGLEVPLGGASTAEIGYMNQAINRTGGQRAMNHIASFTLFFRH